MEKKQIGFTLIECLVSLSLFSIVLSYGLSWMSSLVKKKQFQVVVDQLAEAITSAKTEALVTGNAVVLAPLSGRKSWSHGIRFFVDKEHQDASTTVPSLYERNWDVYGVFIEWHGFQSNHQIRFTEDIRHSTANGYFTVTNAVQQVKLVVNRLGRLKVL